MRKPSDVFEQKIHPALEDHMSDPLSERRANGLAVAINDQVEWTYKYYDQHDRSRLSGATLKEFREDLFGRCPDLRVMWDLAEADKHRILTRNRPRIVEVSSAAYAVEDNVLRITGYDRPFSQAAKSAVEFWRKWPD